MRKKFNFPQKINFVKFKLINICRSPQNTKKTYLSISKNIIIFGLKIY